MRITLMHNPKAGHGNADEDELVDLLEAAGYEVDYQSVKKKKWKKALEEPGELVVVAGGDGTVAKVAGELAGRRVPIAIIPLGTANNIATSLGVRGSLDEVIAGWKDARRRKFDIGIASGPWGETRFLEAVGGGLFTQTMALVETNEETVEPDDREEELTRDLGFLRMTLDDARARPYRVTLDGEDLSGDYFLVEVMNLPLLGPNVCLAPDAAPGDGRLNVVLLGEDHRNALADYLERLRDGEAEPPALPVRSGRRVEFRWNGGPLHVDSDIFADAELSANGEGAVVDVWIDSDVELLVGGG